MTNLKEIPKTELHSHLDCILSLEAVNILKPGTSEDEYLAMYVAPQRCTNLSHYLEFTKNCVDLLQSKEALTIAVEDLFKQLKNENVLYSEIRFAPHLHTQKGLGLTEIVKTVEAATSQSVKKSGIEARIILCTLCHHTAEMSMEVVKLVEDFQGSYVAAMDIAGDEADFPLDSHIDAFQYAIEREIPRTAHAGEALGPESVWATLKKFQPSRIGHGIHSIEDPKLIDHLVKENIHLEVCPQCNVQTGSVPSLEEHPVDLLFNMGVNIGINTDTRGITNITLTKEYEQLVNTFGWTVNNFRQTNLNAINAAFIPEKVKIRLRDQLLKAYPEMNKG